MQTTKTFKVIVYHDEDTWIATCNALGLTTEAPSYEALIQRAWAIAPELAEANRLCDRSEAIRLAFVHQTQQAPEPLAL